VCPYCYQSCSEREIEFRCTGRPSKTGAQCTTSRDEILANQTGYNAPVFPSFEGDGRQTHATCPACGGDTNYRLCPNCHSQLPVHFGKIDSRLIAMVGARETGKTVFMTVLLHELTHRIGAQYDAAIDGSDDPTRERFAKDYEKRMYDDGELFGATATATAANHAVQPLVFRFTTDKPGLRKGQSQHTLLSFFDTAGEDLRSQELVDLNARYLASADAIILLLDPLRMRGARDIAAPGTKMPTLGDSQDDPVNVLSRITDLLRARLDLKPTAKIDKPIAVAFSKIDALRDQFEQGSALRRSPSNGSAEFDTGDSLDVHHHMQALLHQWEGAQIDQVLEHNYRTHRYFGLSALGETPTPDNRVSERGIRPYRVADPFLWLLSELGVVKATKA
jgi:GTPase SAR1 family protein